MVNQNQTMPGSLITVEGADGAGKTTQLAYIFQWLTNHGIEVVQTREPGGTETGDLLREILLNGKALNISDRAELLMIFAARQQHLDQVILPALISGKCVLSDRFTDATYAYQGGGRGIDAAQIATLENWVQADLRPDLTIVLDIEVALGVERSGHRGETEKDRFESQATNFKQAVRQTYLERAAAEPERMKVVNSAKPIEVVQSEISALLDTFLQRHKRPTPPAG